MRQKPQLTAAERAAVRRFLQTWHTETVKSGFEDEGYISAANYQPEGWEVYKRLRAALGPDGVQAAMFSESEAIAA